MPTRAVLKTLARKHTGPNGPCSVILRSLVPAVSIIIYITQLAMSNKSVAGAAPFFVKTKKLLLEKQRFYLRRISYLGFQMESITK